MSRRLRKKQLKKLGKYVNPSECWNLDITICEWIIPRLKEYKNKTIGYPPIDRKLYAEKKELKEITFEEWQIILDEIILGFEQISYDPFDIVIEKELNLNNESDKEYYYKFCEERQEKIERGLDLFKYYIQDLWW